MPLEIPKGSIDELIKQVETATKKISMENLNLHLIVLAVSQADMCMASSQHVADPLTRINLLTEAIKMESGKLQQALHNAAQAEVMKVVQQSTEKMTKQ